MPRFSIWRRSDSFRAGSVSRVSARATKTFRAGIGVEAAKDHDTPLADAWKIADGFFQFLGVQIATAPDDNVLSPAGQIDLPFGDIGQVTGIQPRSMK